MTPALFVCPNLHGGGAERQWATLLPALRAHGIEPALVTLDGRGPFFDGVAASGVPVLDAGLRSRHDVRGLGRAARFAWRHRPRVVVSRSVSGQLAGHALARGLRVPHVTTEHSPCDARGRFLPLSPRRRALTRLVAPRIDAVVMVTAAQRAACRAYGYHGERLRVIGNGTQPAVDDERLRAGTRRALGLPDDAVVAMLVAGLRPEKRVADFIAAVAGARAQDPRVTGLIAGDGALRDFVRTHATHPGLRWLGFRPDAPALMAAADVVCLTSSHEALPMVVLEAMAAGRPVVASRVGGVADAVDDGRTGLLFDVGATDELTGHLLRLAREPGARTAMGAAGRDRHAARYTEPAMVARYTALLHELARTERRCAS